MPSMETLHATIAVHRTLWVILIITCIPKPYKIVGYDPLIIGYNPQNSGFGDPQVRLMGIYDSNIIIIGPLKELQSPILIIKAPKP